MRSWMLGIAVLVGCGGDDGGGPACGATCAELGVECGTLTDACGAPLDCGLCRYTATPGVGGDPVLAPTDTPTVVSSSGGAVEVSTLGTSGWTREVAITGQTETLRDDLEIIGDTRWVIALDRFGNDAVIAFSVAGGGWTTEPFLGHWNNVALTADADGRLVVAAVGSAAIEMGGVSGNGAFVFTRVGAAWQGEQVASAPSVISATVVEVAVAAGVRHVFWAEGGTLHHGASAGGAGTAWQLDDLGVMSASAADAGSNSIDVVVDTLERLHLIYETGGASALGGEGAIHQVLDGGGWTASPPLSSWRDGSNAIAVTRGGRVFAAYYTTSALVLAELVRGAWATQVINGDCDDGEVDLGIGPADELRVVRACSGGGSFLERTGAYPAEYGPACQGVVDAMCAAACDCATAVPGSDCCVRSPGNSSCSGSFGCPSNTYAALCGDPTQDPALVYACADELAAPMCFADQAQGDGGLDLAVGSACATLRFR